MRHGLCNLRTLRVFRCLRLAAAHPGSARTRAPWPKRQSFSSLALVPLFNTPEDPQWSGSGAPIEYAVKMRRFAQSARLDQVCKRGELLPLHLSGLARLRW